MSDLEIDALIDYLAGAQIENEIMWRDWRITRITGGMNNRLYRATNGARDLAIKFTIRDARDRAGREYNALLALQNAGLDLAPQPILIDRDRYALPVVAQTWLAGDVINAPPTTDAEWTRLINHYAAIHTLTPDHAQIELPAAVITAHRAEEAIARVREQIAQIPNDARPAPLIELIARLDQTRFPEWDQPRVAFCRVDPNIANFVRGVNKWKSVDWENAGWGDPAYEIADLVLHPAYIGTPSSRWEWWIENYCARVNDPGAATRIQTYRKIISVWWVARLARYLNDIPRGGDKRLVEPSRDWQIETQTKFDHYVNLASQAIS